MNHRKPKPPTAHSCISYRNGRLQIKIVCGSSTVVDFTISNAQMITVLMALSNLVGYLA